MTKHEVKIILDAVEHIGVPAVRAVFNGLNGEEVTSADVQALRARCRTTEEIAAEYEAKYAAEEK